MGHSLDFLGAPSCCQGELSAGRVVGSLGGIPELNYLANSSSEVVEERQQCPFFIKCIYKHTERETFFLSSQ